MEKFLKVTEVAEILNFTPAGVYQLTFKNKIPVVRISRRCLRFRPEDIGNWLREKTQTVQSAGETEAAARRTSRSRRGRLKDSSVDSIVRNAKKEILGKEGEKK